MVGSRICKPGENKLIIENKGLINYQECRDEMIALVKSSPKIHHIWVVEHPPVFTIGISEKNIEEDLSKNPPVIKTDRGGKITFHAPGQIVIYFILNLKEVSFKPTSLTSTILNSTSDTLWSFGLEHQINLEDPGIYINNKKIASIGMRIKNHISYHGLSINFETDLKTFNSINPCGLDVEACNLIDYIDIDKQELLKKLLQGFKKVIN